MRFILSILSLLIALAAAAVVLLWLISRIATDRWLITQYLFWLPTLGLLGGGAILLAASWTLGMLARRRRRTPAARLRRLSALAWVIILAFFFFVELRVQNAVAGPPPPSQLRVLHWNVSGVHDPEQILAAINAEAPDVVILSNAYGNRPWRDVIEGFEHSAQVWDAAILILSRAPIARYGVCWLGLTALKPETDLKLGAEPNHHDPGRAVYLELHAPEFADPLILWVIDLPSDWRHSRWKVAALAAQAIAQWRGPERFRGTRGDWSQSTPLAPGFPRPDLIVGDFNIPRGSASLDLLAAGMRHAFDQAGFGYAATYPAERPLLHIDHTFVGPRLQATRHLIQNPGPGARHRLQVTDLVKSPAANGQ